VVENILEIAGEKCGPCLELLMFRAEKMFFYIYIAAANMPPVLFYLLYPYSQCRLRRVIIISIRRETAIFRYNYMVVIMLLTLTTRHIIILIA